MSNFNSEQVLTEEQKTLALRIYFQENVLFICSVNNTSFLDDSIYDIRTHWHTGTNWQILVSLTINGVTLKEVGYYNIYDGGTATFYDDGTYKLIVQGYSSSRGQHIIYDFYGKNNLKLHAHQYYGTRENLHIVMNNGTIEGSELIGVKYDPRKF